MEIIENRAAWEAEFKAGWLAHYQATGETNWKLYNLPRNKEAPAGAGITLSQARIMLISSAGGYLKGEQEPFDAADKLGDYSIRVLPAAATEAEIDYAHDHYDQTAVRQDFQVLLPLRHLEELAAEGQIGSPHPHVISFMGYQPAATQVVDETIPAILEVIEQDPPDGVLLVPS